MDKNRSSAKQSKVNSQTSGNNQKSPQLLRVFRKEKKTGMRQIIRKQKGTDCFTSLQTNDNSENSSHFLKENLTLNSVPNQIINSDFQKGKCLVLMDPFLKAIGGCALSKQSCKSQQREIEDKENSNTGETGRAPGTVIKEDARLGWWPGIGCSQF